MDQIDLIVKMAMDTKEYADGLAESTKGTTAWAGALGTAVSAGVAVAVAALAFLAGAIIGIGVASFNVANETQEAWNQYAAQTGAANEEMEQFKQTALDIYSSNWGDSITDVGQAMTTVKQITGETGDELESLTTKALIMRDVFGKDINESIRAVDIAVTNFGTNGSHVFDLVAATIQKVGDPADDLLDTVGEYAPIFAAAGYSADEMFGILQAGVAAGARNFDVVADAVKEFQIRIIDGSDQTESAMNTLLASTGRVSDEYVTLESKLKDTSDALEANTEALDSAEGAYAASKAVVDDLSRALGEAKRALSDLSHPNLAGMEAYDNQLFELEQQSKAAKLAMLDMVPDGDAYEAAKQQLDDINKEMDKVALQRDLQFDRQLRDIEKAATEGQEPLTTYDEVMGQIGAKKGEIAELEGAFAGATAEMEGNAAAVAALESENKRLTTNIDDLKAGLEAIGSPAEQWLKGLEDGSMSGKEAMDQVNQMLRESDQATRDAVGPLIYGTKWEDLKDTIILSMGEGVHYAQDVDGALADAGETAHRGLGWAFDQLKKRALTSLQPLGDALYDLAEKIMPFVGEAFNWFDEKLPGIMETAGYWIGYLGDVIAWDVVPYVNNELLPVFMEFADWLVGEGIPAFVEFITPIIDQVVPGLKLLGSIAMDIAGFVLPLLVQWWQFLADHMNIVMPIIAAVGVLILALTSPVSLVIGAIVLLATAWANNWGGIQEKVQAVMDFVMPYIQAGMAFISKVVSDVLGYIQGWWKAHGESVMALVNAAWQFITFVIDKNLSTIWTVIQVVLALAQQFWEDWGETIMTVAALVWDTITVIFSTVFDNLGYLLDAFVALFKGDWKGFGDALGSIWRNTWGAIEDILNNAKTAIITVIVGFISNFIDNYWQPFVDGISEAWDNVWNGLADIVNGVMDTVQTAIQPVSDFIDDIWQKIQGILDTLPGLPSFGGEAAANNFAANVPGGRGDETNNNFTQINNFSGSGFDSTGQFAQTKALLTT